MHGGHFRIGAKSRESRRLLFRFARRGWLCISANYRLGAAGAFPNSLVDVKRVVAWVRKHADEYGADASLVVLAGSSAGAHLASMAALTPDQPELQPGFEDVDTSIAGAVCLYGYYGDRESAGDLPSSPMHCVSAGAPPFFVAHGLKDTLVPASSAARFVAALRAVSNKPVVYVPLPGGQHSFDLFSSPRYEKVIDGIEVFTEWVAQTTAYPRPPFMAPQPPGIGGPAGMRRPATRPGR